MVKMVEQLISKFKIVGSTPTTLYEFFSFFNNVGSFALILSVQKNGSKSRISHIGRKIYCRESTELVNTVRWH